MASSSLTSSTAPTPGSGTEKDLSRWNTVNTHWAERGASGLGGAALITYGLLRRDWLGVALSVFGGALAYRGIVGHSYLYQALKIDTHQRNLPPSASVAHNQGIKVEKVLTIERSPEDLYQFWRHFEQLPRFMSHLREVQIQDELHSHWVAKAPAGRTVEWDAEIINDTANQFIAWRSLPGSDIANAGSVHFVPAPGDRGTEVRVVLEYVPPVGRAGLLVAKLFGQEPEQQVREDLRHFKEIMEAGEVPVIKGQPSGRSH
jgi:uncharacterized membrane protein